MNIGYIAPDGSNTLGDGTIGNPWKTPEYALANLAHDPQRIVRCHSGTYPPAFLTALHNGTPGYRTIIEAVTRRQAVFADANGSQYHNFSINNYTLTTNPEHWELRGLGSTRAFSDGIKIGVHPDAGTGRASDIVMMDCESHDNGGQGISGGPIDGILIDLCDVNYNGTSDLYNHGIYVTGDGVVVMRCRGYNNASHFVHIYTTTPGDVLNVLIALCRGVRTLPTAAARAYLVWTGQPEAYQTPVRIVGNTAAGGGWDSAVNIRRIDGAVIKNNAFAGAYSAATISESICENTVRDYNCYDGLTGETNGVDAEPELDPDLLFPLLAGNCDGTGDAATIAALLAELGLVVGDADAMGNPMWGLPTVAPIGGLWRPLLDQRGALRMQ